MGIVSGWVGLAQAHTTAPPGAGQRLSPCCRPPQVSSHLSEGVAAAAPVLRLRASLAVQEAVQALVSLWHGSIRNDGGAGYQGGRRCAAVAAGGAASRGGDGAGRSAALGRRGTASVTCCRSKSTRDGALQVHGRAKHVCVEGFMRIQVVSAAVNVLAGRVECVGTPGRRTVVS
jgi:hypothetical protein